MVKGSHLIDHRLEIGTTPLFPDGEMGDHLTGEGNQALQAVCIHPVGFQVLFVESDHCGEVAARRGTAEEDLFRASSVATDILVDPGNRSRGVLHIGGGLHGRAEAIAGGDDHDPFVF